MKKIFSDVKAGFMAKCVLFGDLAHHHPMATTRWILPTPRNMDFLHVLKVLNICYVSQCMQVAN
jgi:hypothetical protein